MNRREMIAFLGTVFLGIGGTMTWAQLPPPPDYYPLKVGDWWEYESTTSTGNKSSFKVEVLSQQNRGDNGELYEVKIQSGIEINEWYSKPNGWVLWHEEVYPSKGQRVEFKPVRKFLKNPMISGDSWEWIGKGIMGVEIQELSQVVGSEEVKVPAGNFNTLKVVIDLTQAGVKMKKTMWFADQIGMIKSTLEGSSFQTTSELVKYNLKR